MTVITSATSVIWAGASRSRSSRRELRSDTSPEKTRYPIATALTVAISTAPAAMSLASFASGSNDVVATSIPASSAELIISAIRTNEIASISAISSIRPTPTATAAISTAAAIAKWIRMFRCVRRTWITPSNAKLKLSRSDGRRRGDALTPAPPRVAPSRRRGRSRAGAGARGRAGRARRRRRPAGRGRRRRADVARLQGARPARRSGTRARPWPRPLRGDRASAHASRPARRMRARGLPRRCPRPPERGAQAPRRPPRRPRCRFDSRSRPSPRCGSLPPLRAGLLRVLAVRLDDALHELVPNDVFVAEADERDPVERAENVLHLDQARRLLTRKVDLRDVAGDDDLRPEAEARQEHLHLLGARVLRLVEDHERVVQRAPPHEGERRDLDDALLHVRGEAVCVEHVVERVEEGPQVRVDLLEHRAGQVAEALPRLDRGTREDDPAH